MWCDGCACLARSAGGQGHEEAVFVRSRTITVEAGADGAWLLPECEQSTPTGSDSAVTVWESESVLQAEEVTCPEGHVCTQLVPGDQATAEEELGRFHAGWCRACRERCGGEEGPDAPAAWASSAYRCGTCGFELCPRCAALPARERAQLVEATGRRYTSAASLVEAAGAGGAARLLSGRWLLAFEQSRRAGEPLGRQQDLPADAFVEPASLAAKGVSRDGAAESYVVVAVSHCWLTEQHPDPRGEQLSTLAHVLSHMRAYVDSTCSDIALFFDFCSLPQQPISTVAEELARQNGLKDVNLWYAHRSTWVLMLTQPPSGWEVAKTYWERGWPTFERLVSTLVKDCRMCLDLGRMEGKDHSDFCDIMQQCVTARHRAPPSPKAFAEAVGRLHFFGGEPQKVMVVAKYRETVSEILAYVEDVGFKSRGWGANEVEELVQVLPMAPRLQRLVLEKNRIGDSGATLLAHACSSCPTIKLVNLGHNDIGDDGAVALARALPNCIETLQLSGNHIGGVGASALAKALRGWQALTELWLPGNQLGDEGATTLAQALPECPTIARLGLGGNRIGNAGAIPLLYAMRGCPSLQELRLDSNLIDRHGVAPGRIGSPSLKALHLDRNHIGNPGAAALAQALLDCPSIEHLCLDFTGIGNAGAVELAKALLGCPDVQVVLLAENKISNPGALALAQALPACPAMRWLDLAGNRVGVSGARALQAAAEAQGVVRVHLAVQPSCCGLQ